MKNRSPECKCDKDPVLNLTPKQFRELLFIDPDTRKRFCKLCGGRRERRY